MTPLNQLRCMIAGIWLVAALPGLAAEFYRGWRGDHTGYFPAEDNPPTSWSTTTNVRWKVELPPRGGAAPVIVGDRVFVLRDPSHLYCLDKSSGEVLWHVSMADTDTWTTPHLWKTLGMQNRLLRSKSTLLVNRLRILELNAKRLKAKTSDDDLAELSLLEARIWEAKREQVEADEALERVGDYYLQVGHVMAGLTHPTPCTDGKRIYVVLGSGNAGAYDLDGNKIWTRFIERGNQAAGNTTSPTLSDGKLIVTLNNTMALDPESGKTLWVSETGSGYHSPVPARIADTPIVITGQGFVVRSSDGKLLGKFDLPKGTRGGRWNRSPYTSPYLWDGRIHFPDVHYRIFNLPESVPDDAGKDTLYTNMHLDAKYKGTRPFGSASPHPDHIFGADKSRAKTPGYENVFNALDMATGESLHEERFQGKWADIYGSSSTTPGYYFATTSQGETSIFRATSPFNLVSRNALDEKFVSCITLDGGRAYIRTHPALWCVEMLSEAQSTAGKSTVELMTLFKSPLASDREAAVAALSKNPPPVTTLAPLLGEGFWWEQQCAGHVLQNLGVAATEASAGVSSYLLSSLSAGRHGATGLALNTLKAIDPAAAKALVPELAARCGDDQEGVRRIALDALHDLKQESAALPVYGEALRGSDVRKMAEAALNIGKVSPSGKAEGSALVVPLLAKHLAADDRLLALHCALALETFGSAAEAAVPQLIAMLDSKTEGLPVAVAKALIQVGPAAKAAIPALVKSMMQEEDKALALVSGTALGAIGADALPALTALASGMNERASMRAMRVISQIIRDAKGAELPGQAEALNALGANVSGGKGGRALAALAAIESIGPAAKTTVASVVSQLESDRQGIPAASARALAAMGPEGRSAIPKLTRALGGSNLALAIDAAGALGAMAPGSESALSAMTAALKRPVKALRKAAIEAIASLGEAGGAAIPALLAANASDPSLGRACLAALRKIKSDNKPPRAEGGIFKCPKGKSVEMHLTVSDVDNLPVSLKVEVVEQPQHGTLTDEGQLDFTYEPAASFMGEDRFRWKAKDEDAESDVVTSRIQVGN